MIAMTTIIGTVTDHTVIMMVIFHLEVLEPVHGSIKVRPNRKCRENNKTYTGLKYRDWRRHRYKKIVTTYIYSAANSCIHLPIKLPKICLLKFLQKKENDFNDFSYTVS